jgi:hypothetical protein
MGRGFSEFQYGLQWVLWVTEGQQPMVTPVGFPFDPSKCVQLGVQTVFKYEGPCTVIVAKGPECFWTFWKRGHGAARKPMKGHDALYCSGGARKFLDLAEEQGAQCVNR